MIFSCLSEEELQLYLIQQNRSLLDAISELDDSWIHSGIIKELCCDAMNQIEQLRTFTPPISTMESKVKIELKTEKYTRWVETMRLAFFQYSRFTEKKYARSEALYSTLCSLALTWSRRDVNNIVVPGCGPGRSVLDFARLYPATNVVGLDYSLLALILGNQIVCDVKKTYLLQRDINAKEEISKMYTIDGFGLKNASFGIIDLISCKIPECDILVCSNTINLLPDHGDAVKKIAQAVRTGGIVIYADLIGWRLDRCYKRRLLHDDLSIRQTFEEYGFITLDMFSGVPYIESESDDQETCYNEHFYVGRRR